MFLRVFRTSSMLASRSSCCTIARVVTKYNIRVKKTISGYYNYSTPYYSCSIVTMTSTLSLTTSCCLSRPKYSESKIAFSRWSHAWPRLCSSEHQCTKNQMPHSYSGVRSQPGSTHEPLATNRDHCSLSQPTERVRRHQRAMLTLSF
jgi:hypothetical protein